MLQILSKKENKRFILALLALFLLSILFCVNCIFISKNYASTLEPQYVDIVRHQIFSFYFLKIGMSIFNTPLKYLEKIGPWEAYHVWSELPEMYPIGAVLFFLPFSLASFFNIYLVNKIILIIIILIAHISLAIYLLEEINRKEEIEYGIFIIIYVIFFIWMVIWSLNGQYDPIPIALLLLSLKYFNYRKIKEASIFFTLALTLKYQTLFYFPFGVLLFKILIDNFNLKNLKDLVLITLLILVNSLNFYTLLLSYPFYEKIPVENPLHIFRLITNDYEQFPYLLILLSVFLVLILLTFNTKNYLVGSTMLCFAIFPLIMKQFQMWYVLWLFPATLLAKNKKEFVLISFIIIYIIYIFGFIPNLKHITWLFTSLYN